MDCPAPTLPLVRMCHTHQQRDLSLSDNVYDVLVLLALLIHLPSCSSESSWCHTDRTPSSWYWSPGFGGVLPAHVTPWQGEHQS